MSSLLSTASAGRSRTTFETVQTPHTSADQPGTSLIGNESQPSSSKNDSDITSTAIIGISAGIGGFTIAIVFLVLFIFMRRHKKAVKSSTAPPSICRSGSGSGSVRGSGTGGMEEARARSLLDPWPDPLHQPPHDQRSLYTSGIGSTRSTYTYYQPQDIRCPAELDEAPKHAGGARNQVHYREPHAFAAELPGNSASVV